MRIVTGCISHETSTFTPVVTMREGFFDRFGDVRELAIIEKFRGTTTPTGGFIEGAEAHGFDLIPTIFAKAHTGGPAPRALFDGMLHELLDGITAVGQIDGVLLELHGAMVAEGVDAGEGHILEAMRKLVGRLRALHRRPRSCGPESPGSRRCYTDPQ